MHSSKEHVHVTRCVETENSLDECFCFSLSYSFWPRICIRLHIYLPTYCIFSFSSVRSVSLESHLPLGFWGPNLYRSGPACSQNRRAL